MLILYGKSFRFRRYVTVSEVHDLECSSKRPPNQLEFDMQTSNTAAAVLATHLDIAFSNAIVKNRYVHRTFILPGQKARQKGVRRKLSPILSEFKGKNVCLVDDSIVRGTTSREIVRILSYPTSSHRRLLRLWSGLCLSRITGFVPHITISKLAYSSFRFKWPGRLGPTVSCLYPAPHQLYILIS